MLETTPSLRERITAHYASAASLIAGSFAGTPIVYTTFPQGFAHDATWHGALDGPPPAGAATVTVALKKGRRAYLALTAGMLSELAAEPKGAIEFHGWGCTSADPGRARFARILLERDAPPPSSSAADGTALAQEQPHRDLVDGALLMRDQLAELRLQAVPLIAGKESIALWIPIDGGPAYADVRTWLHGIAGRAVERHPGRFTEDFDTHRDGRIHLHVSSNAPGRSSALPYSLRGTPDLLVCTPATWNELPDFGACVNAETFADRLARYGDVFGDQVAAIGAQSIS